MASPFSTVRSARVPRSVFNLSYNKKLSCDMGQLIPVLCDEVVPGDVWEIGMEAVIRLQPLVAPVLHPINVFLHVFFAPYRLLDDTFEGFITGGVAGDDSTVIPRWEPTDTSAKSLWDYLGFPVGIDPDGAYPLDYPRRAYNRTYNEYYRDENLITEVDEDNEDILFRCWQKDYFASALPWQQRGTAPALTLGGAADVVGTDVDFLLHTEADATDRIAQLVTGSNTLAMKSAITGGTSDARWGAATGLEADLSTSTPIDLADMRLAFAIQQWMERNARGGVRYTEFLRSHYGTAPRDDTLQRVQFIGGARFPVITSEVLQTSETGATAQGNMAGHGLAVDRGRVCRFRANEFGLVLGIMSIMPGLSYNSQGINRQWLRETRYDFYSPEFANLSEQAIKQAELYATAVESENTATFGFQGNFDEMRTKQDMCVADMRDTFDYWHLARQFASAPALNAAFVTCDGTTADMKRIFAAQDEDGFLVNWGNVLRVMRPLPGRAEPRMWS